MRPFHALPLAAVLLAGCSPLFFAEVKEERLCVALQDRTVDAAPPVVAGLGPQTVTWSGDLDLGSKIPGLDDRKAVTGSIRMLSMTVTGSTDLTGVTAADLTVVDDAGAATSFMHYAPPSVAPDRLDLAVDGEVNLLEKLEGGRLHYAITFAGTPPTTPWTAQIESCLAIEVKVDALAAMQ